FFSFFSCSCSCPLFFYFLSAAVYLRDLPSFPTRRSSDLLPDSCPPYHQKLNTGLVDRRTFQFLCLDNNSFSAPPARRQIQILTFSYPLSKTFSYPFLMQSPHLSNSLRVCAITCEKLSCRARYVIFSNSFIVSVDMISFI